MSIPQENRRRIVVGVDTHKHNHVAVALDQVGAVLGSTTISVNRAGYVQLSDWAVGLAAEYDSGQVLFGVEGTGSYGAGLAFVPAAGGRPGRRGQSRRPHRATPTRQERHHRRRDRRPQRPVRHSNRHPEDR
ncbi:transposase [Pseudonocardia sp. KRD291]|uniref:IS110 family transposase n=1 Tax=Pseudonocardia sp. KRD291 TaxID=2792007 RepID=UPI001C4A2DEC